MLIAYIKIDHSICIHRVLMEFAFGLNDILHLSTLLLQAESMRTIRLKRKASKQRTCHLPDFTNPRNHFVPRATRCYDQIPYVGPAQSLSTHFTHCVIIAGMDERSDKQARMSIEFGEGHFKR